MIVTKMSSGASSAQEASLASSTLRVGAAADLASTTFETCHPQNPSYRTHPLYMDIEMNTIVLIPLSIMLPFQG